MITPWNFPIAIPAWKIAPALAYGNCVVFKPADLVPGSAWALAEILARHGIPPGVFNLVMGRGSDVGAAMLDDTRVAAITFTGSVGTGKRVAAACVSRMAKFQLEMGGKNPMIVLDDADLPQAVNAAVFGAFFHQGQICLNTRKVLVERPIHDRFLDALVAKTRQLPTGDPANPATIIGPLINDQAVRQVQERIGDAVERGARLLTGGDFNGRVCSPAILADVPHDAAVTRGDEETFGPVLVVEAVDDAEAALARAHHTPYGLSAAIMTGDQRRGLELAQRFDAGIVHVNGPTMAGEPSLPNGGVKVSGWGRSGHYAIEDFTELRLTTLTEGAIAYPF
jgi:acyl-CoA reductase-like NAD-dependent aldehyde dehydrogenase